MIQRRVSGTVWQMLILLAVSAAGIAAARFAYERPLPLDYTWSSHVMTFANELGMQTVTLAETKDITESYSHLVLDARDHADYLAGRLPGAMSLPINEYREYFIQVAPLLSDDFPILIYSRDIEDDEALKLGEILLKSGYTNVTLFAGGMAEWTDAGYTVEQ